MLSKHVWQITSYYSFLQLVGRLSQEELMAQLPSFLPSLFEAFGNQSADVRKVLGSLTFFEIFGYNFVTVKEQRDVCICVYPIYLPTKNQMFETSLVIWYLLKRIWYLKIVICSKYWWEIILVNKTKVSLIETSLIIEQNLLLYELNIHHPKMSYEIKCWTKNIQ